jgi:DNA helicase HerA-like ATPase
MIMADGPGGNGFRPAATRRLGQIVGGSLSRGLDVRLDASDAGIEDVAVGSFVTIQGRRQKYFAVVTDVELRAVDDSVRHFPPAFSPNGITGGDYTAEVIAGTVAYGQLSVMPGMAMSIGASPDGIAEQAKTIPEHFAPVYAASQADIDAVFRAGEGDFALGSPQGMEASVVRLDLGTLVNRSVGVFGASGTGKTFLARMLLAGLVKQTHAVSLVFDMESEYGWQGQDNDRGRQVKGLKQLFPSRVVTFTLDESSSRRRGVAADGVVRIGYGEIEPADIEVLRESLGLSAVAAAAAYNLERHFGSRNWLAAFVAAEGPDLPALSEAIGVNGSALAALHRRLSAWRRFEFLDADAAGNSAGNIVEHLLRGNHVVLEFGQYGRNEAAYVLVSNLLTRRIHEEWVRRKELADGGQGDDPRPLVIFIEEAHKFLTPEVASQTVFGAIARELRKYNVTLMIVDQRPSGIDSEVMSQLGTRLSCALNDDRDMNAVLMGARDAGQLRNVLARLDSKQQALVFGHAVPMPVVVRPRDYDEAFYAEMVSAPGRAVGAALAESDADRMQREIDELFPPE